MTSPVSIGDAFLMAKLAFKIGQAFTKGRKSAPSEFREIESQLYSLSAALDALTSTTKASSSSSSLSDLFKLSKSATHHVSNEDAVIGMLQSCRETLGHLESIIDQYSVIGTTSDTGQPRLKRFHHDLKLNWKKIMWTTEGGDLSALKSNLMVQTNSLNLVLSVIVNSQSGRLQKDMNDVSMKLSEIHKWFMDNLQSNREIASAPASSTTSAVKEAPRSAPCFELYENSGKDLILICPQASLGQTVSLDLDSTSLRNSQMFNCSCSSSRSGSVDHRSTVEAFKLSPLSFSTRIAGKDRSWLLYKVANGVTNQLKSLVVKNVPANAMHDFEELLTHGINVPQTREMFRHGESNTLAFISESSSEFGKANLLNMVSNSATLQRSVATVSFTYNKMRVLRIEHIMNGTRLHYSDFSEDRTAEIIISYRNGTDDQLTDNLVNNVLTLKWNTNIQQREEDGIVILKDVDCIGVTSNGTSHPSTSATVALDFSAHGAAAQFKTEVEAMRMELFVLHLQHPRENEQTLLKLQAYDVHTERMHICNAEIAILQNTITQRFRLVVQSGNGYTILSQELRREFFDKLAAGGRPDYGGESYEVFMKGSGERVIQRCASGFTHLVFTDNKIDEGYNIGLLAVGGACLTNVSQPMEGIEEHN